MTKETKKLINTEIAKLRDDITSWKMKLTAREPEADVNRHTEIRANTCKTVFYGYLDALETLGYIDKEERKIAMSEFTAIANAFFFDPLAE